MTTKVIGIKEFRKNLTKLGKKTNGKNVRFIVMRHTVPLFEVKPIDEDELTDELLLEKYAKDIEEALRQVERGEVYSSEEMLERIRRRK